LTVHPFCQTCYSRHRFIRGQIAFVSEEAFVGPFVQRGWRDHWFRRADLPQYGEGAPDCALLIVYSFVTFGRQAVFGQHGVYKLTDGVQDVVAHLSHSSGCADSFNSSMANRGEGATEDAQ
jgi:hypothetical protein